MNKKFFLFVLKEVWKMYEMKMNNLLVNVEIFSLCRKETLFRAECQQYKVEIVVLFSHR